MTIGFQTSDPNVATPNNNDGFVTSTPVMTFIDPSSGQPYGRYIVNETVPVVEYSYQPVKERIYVPKTVTEPKTITVTRYTPIQSYQLQLRNVPRLNPFASPQQVWQYVPIVQYQPNYVQETQLVTYQKYEEKEVEKQIPVLTPRSIQVQRYEDRPLGQAPNSGNGLATNSPVANPNFYQQAAQIAQVNRNLSRYPTRSIDYPYNPGYQRQPSGNLLAQAPAPYYPNFNPNPYYATNPMIPGAYATNQQMPSANPYAASPPPGNNMPPVNNMAVNNTASSNIVIPAVPLRPNMQPDPNALAGYNGYGNQNYQANPNQAYPYANTASRPLFNWQSFTSGTGSLFSNGLFNSNRNANYVASNTPAAQPYVWGNNLNGLTFRPNTSPYVTPQQSWGMTTGNSYREPMQGGMPATVMR